MTKTDLKTFVDNFDIAGYLDSAVLPAEIIAALNTDCKNIMKCGVVDRLSDDAIITEDFIADLVELTINKVAASLS